jgi:hypothetical protein
LKNERLERELNLQEQQIAEMEKIYGESLPSATRVTIITI